MTRIPSSQQPPTDDAPPRRPRASSKRRRLERTSRPRSLRWSACRAPRWRGAGRRRRAGGAAEDARAADLALALRARRHRLRRDDQRVEGAARRARRAFHPGAARSRGRAGLGRRHAQMAAAAAGRAAGEQPHEVECVYIPETDRGTLCVSSQVGCTLNCSFCHTGTQRLVRNLTAGRDRRPDHGRARPAGRMAWRQRGADGGVPTGKRLRLQRRDDGHGRAALQFRGGARRAPDRRGRRRHRHLQAPDHALDLGRGADDRARRRRDRLHAGGLAARGA